MRVLTRSQILNGPQGRAIAAALEEVVALERARLAGPTVPADATAPHQPTNAPRAQEQE